mmetsp:Transcript_29271/g.92344  ORF Transcript_29271/g.92344 Transcript_29271/m.92344 type:complete len:437 (-) Transcript_29271:26-1336(-)
MHQAAWLEQLAQADVARLLPEDARDLLVDGIIGRDIGARRHQRFGQGGVASQLLGDDRLDRRRAKSGALLEELLSLTPASGTRGHQDAQGLLFHSPPEEACARLNGLVLNALVRSGGLVLVITMGANDADHARHHGALRAGAPQEHALVQGGVERHLPVLGAGGEDEEPPTPAANEHSSPTAALDGPGLPGARVGCAALVQHRRQRLHAGALLEQLRVGEVRATCLVVAHNQRQAHWLPVALGILCVPVAVDVDALEREHLLLLACFHGLEGHVSGAMPVTLDGHSLIPTGHGLEETALRASEALDQRVERPELVPQPIGIRLRDPVPLLYCVPTRAAQVVPCPPRVAGELLLRETDEVLDLLATIEHPHWGLERDQGGPGRGEVREGMLELPLYRVLASAAEGDRARVRERAACLGSHGAHRTHGPRLPGEQVST